MLTSSTAKTKETRARGSSQRPRNVMALTNYLIPRITIFLILCVIWMSINGGINGVQAQSSPSPPEPSTTSATKVSTEAIGETRPVNLIIVNVRTNEIANMSVTNSLKTMRDENPDLIGKVWTITVDGRNPKDDLKQICDVWDVAIKEKPMDVPDFLLDTTKSGFASEAVSAFTAAMGIPTLSGQFGQEADMKNWQALHREQYKYLVQVMPPTDLIPEAVRQLSYQMNISNVAVIFDEDYTMTHKYKSLLMNIPTRHVMVPMKKSGDELRLLLLELKNLDVINYFIIGGEKTVKSVLNVAETMDFTNFHYGWYILTQDDFEPRCACQNLTVIFFKPLISSMSQHRLNNLMDRKLITKPVLLSAFYYDLARLGVTAMSTSIAKSKWPMNPIHLACGDFRNGNTPVRLFDFYKELVAASAKSKLQSAFGFTWAGKNGYNGAKFDMTAKMLKIIVGNTNSSEDLGIWPAGVDSYFQVKNDGTVRSHRGIPNYRITTVIKAPFIMYDPETKVWSGYCIELINDIAALLNFTYDISEVADKKAGVIDKNGNWSGMMGELLSNRADIALGALSVMAERENVVDFSVPYYDLVGISILMQKPQSETSLFKFLTVLENKVWLCILGSYFFASFLMWAFERWSPYSYQNNREKYKDAAEQREFDLLECLWFCMTSLTPQGGGEAPKNLSGRLVDGTWWLFGFIIIASYTANLAAFLTVSRLETPAESLDDLSKQYKVQYAPIIDSEAYIYFQRMAGIETRFNNIWQDMTLNDSMGVPERANLAIWDYPVSNKYTKIFQAMKDATFPRDMKEALERVRHKNPKIKNDFAFIGDATDIRYLVMTNCDLLMIGSEFSRKPYALAVQEGSPLKDVMNNAILQLLNERKLEKLKSRWWDRNPNKVTCDKYEEQNDGISISNIGGVFIVICVGIIMACSTLAVEYYWYRYRPNRKQQSDLNASLKAEATRVSPKKFTLKPGKIPFEADQLRLRF